MKGQAQLETLIKGVGFRVLMHVFYCFIQHSDPFMDPAQPRYQNLGCIESRKE